MCLFFSLFDRACLQSFQKSAKTASRTLQVPKCENFDLLFYVNKSYLDRQPKDWTDIRYFIFVKYAECALKNGLRTLSVR